MEPAEVEVQVVSQLPLFTTYSPCEVVSFISAIV